MVDVLVREEFPVKYERWRMEREDKAIEAVEGVEAVDHRYSQEGGYSTFIVGTDPESEPRAALAVTVVSGGWELLRLQSVGMSLEEIFLQVTTEETIPEPVAVEGDEV